MRDCRLFVGFCVCLLMSVNTQAQRSYRSNSVLASGNFYKLAVTKPGVYRIDLPFLNSLGINTANLASKSVRLYGNSGKMLAESNSGPWVDDLQENAIQANDGGDGLLNGNDYLLFYTEGPHHWEKDSANLRFIHKKNIYSDSSYYFLSIGGDGKRISQNPVLNNPAITVTSFTERQYHELDSVNFLASGKEWYGEEFANIPGKTTTRDFSITVPNALTGSTFTLITNAVARSVGGASRFDIKLNNQLIGQFLINAVTGGQYDLFAQQATAIYNAVINQDNNLVNYNFIPGSMNAQGWLNWFEVFTRRNLSLNNADPLLFRDWNSVAPGNIAAFLISNANNTAQVWDITDIHDPVQMQGTLNGSTYRFVNTASRLKEYVAFNTGNLPLPVYSGKVNPQDLHLTSPVDYIIVTHPLFLAEAQRLASFHQQQNGLRTLVVTAEKIYNEFGSGIPDAVAIRDFLKMYHDKYGTNAVDRVKYLLLFGDGSYDYKKRLNNNSNFVPAWQNNLSLDPLSTYTSDDFYGFLDDQEDINSGLLVNYLDVGIGRVPSKNADEAKNFVDKVIAYYKPAAMGPWRTNFTFIADDEDYNLHLQDAEILTATAASILPNYNIHKIYLDAFQQESGSGGSRYPEANIAINNQVFNGTLIWNYNGHGGAKRLAEETVLDQEIVNTWNNPDRLPLFITATCDFAPYDNPGIQSIGENILVRPKTGGIALMTTTRVVFAFSNRIMNDNYLKIALQPGPDGQFKTLGEAVRDAKNYTYQTSSDVANNRKFTLLGDPALKLAFPVRKVRTVSINGLPVTQVDTLSATEKITVEGEVTDVQGNLLPGFNGTVYPLVLDKPQIIHTRANDPTSQVATFTTQTNVLFKGKASVTNGRFSFSFKVPRDINYQYGNGKLSLYAENGNIDAEGAFRGFIVGGAGTGTDSDKDGPEIKSFLNDERFVNGSITNDNPVLIVKLADSSGINTAGTGIGHDIVATLDGDNNRFFILNDFYQSELNSYQKGTVRFQLPSLSPGEHQLRIKAWDVLNNSNESTLSFTVVKNDELALDHVLNYPNPFTGRTQFWFEHNKPGQDLYVRVQIFTITGRIIKTIQQTINTAGNRSSELEWNGRDEYGEKVGRGTYLYKLSVTVSGGSSKEKIEKMVVL